MADHTELDAAIANLNLIYEAEFVPQHESRNRDSKDRSINWKITLGTQAHGLFLRTDYMQGIGHVPDYPMGLSGRNRSIDEDKKFNLYTSAARTGQYPARYYATIAHQSMKPLPKPELRRLYSLVSDCDVLESSGFEDWASNFGYDTDSRKAEGIYKACIEIALKLKALIGQENLEKLRELYQGY